MVHKIIKEEQEVKSSVYLTEIEDDDVDIGEDFGVDPTQRFALDEDEDLALADDPQLNRIKAELEFIFFLFNINKNLNQNY
jgi:hypothetical protein